MGEETTMRGFFKTVTGKLCIAAVIIVLLAGVGFAAWLYQVPKFQDVTLELGQPLPEIPAFLTEYANAKWAELVTEKADIDLTRVGTQELIFRYGIREETVTLTIQDTTAPAVKFRDVILTAGLSPFPDDFIAEIADYSDVEIRFVQPPDQETYEDIQLQIQVTDAFGNTTTGECTLSWQWLTESYELELGDTLEKADLLLNPEKDDALLDQEALDEINEAPAGVYTVVSTSGAKSAACSVTVRDTTGPELKLKEVYVFLGGSAALEDFVESASDLSGEVKLRLVTELVFDTEGTQTVIVEAEDIYGNVTTQETALHIVTDSVPPTISGLSDMTVAKHSSPNYKSGVSAMDDKDGTVSFTYDASKVDTSKAGTYYVTYTAKDSAGNVTTVKRKVVVSHDAEDTAALVASIANSLSNDPEKIRDYVRTSIRYTSTDYGGDDPIWHGLTEKRGNCWVYANCLKALLDYKGYETQLIWVTSPSKYVKSHYWLLIKLDGGWKHIDATPGVHAKYSLMNDAQRYETLVRDGVHRDWDRSQWPVCN